jgi:NhaA family Na+:H+ antiporter
MNMPQRPGIRALWSRSDRSIPRALQDFLAESASSGVVLVAALIAALVWANAPWRGSYVRLWRTPMELRIGQTPIGTDLRFWIGSGLMTVFFLLVGMEIKREVTSGELRSPRAVALPAIAALGGMLVPALLYLAIAGRGAGSRGWAIPTATDIALALGALALAARFVRPGLRPLLLTLAIVDDIGAVVLVSVFYSGGGTAIAFASAALIIASIVFAERIHIHLALVYVVLGVALWYAFLRAGIQPTMAGVVLGLLAPTTPRIARLERSLLAWSSFVIVPLFVLANAGVRLTPSSLFAGAGAAVAVGIVVARLVGKPLGVVAATRLAIWTRAGRLPAETGFDQILGLGVTAGIGFTVSLFVANLAFADDPTLLDAAKVGIMAAAILAAIASWLTFRALDRRQSSRGVPR